MSSIHIGIIGGGIAGSTAALHFAETFSEKNCPDSTITVSLFEQGPSLVDGPPICHLHAGGNLYREISQQQCVQLLKESIETVQRYPHSLNVRPTVIAVPINDKGNPNDLLPRLDIIQRTYQQLVNENVSYEVLGAPKNYYTLYSKEQLLTLKQQPLPSVDDVNSDSLDEWMIPFAKHADLDQLKYPVVLVQEYGLSVFRLASSVNLALKQLPNCHVYTSTQVTDVTEMKNLPTQKWQIAFQPVKKGVTVDDSEQSKADKNSIEVDYLINASGYQTGVVDDWIKTPRSRLVEFKAAYVTQWQPDAQDVLWPEVIFHGERGTPQGMAQLTPYPDGYFQLHGMTEDITLFEDGLVHSSESSSQPMLPAYLVDKIIKGWRVDQQQLRTDKAIAHMAQFIPSFASAKIGGKPLFGAQQIPGDDANLRAASVSFSGQHYARLEIVKASSAIEAAKQIETQMRQCGLIKACQNNASEKKEKVELSNESVLNYAYQLARARHYPEALAGIGGVVPINE